MTDALIDLFFIAMPLLLIGGVWLQVRALRRFEGGWWLAACVPLLAMGAAVAVAVALAAARVRSLRTRTR